MNTILARSCWSITGVHNGQKVRIDRVIVRIELRGKTSTVVGPFLASLAVALFLALALVLARTLVLSLILRGGSITRRGAGILQGTLRKISHIKQKECVKLTLNPALESLLIVVNPGGFLVKLQFSTRTFTSGRSNAIYKEMIR